MNHEALERRVYFCLNEDYTTAARPFQIVEGVVIRVVSGLMATSQGSINGLHLQVRYAEFGSAIFSYSSRKKIKRMKTEFQVVDSQDFLDQQVLVYLSAFMNKGLGIAHPRALVRGIQYHD